MMNKEDLKKIITAILTRPEMWAGSAEALELCVLVCTQIYTNTDHYSTWRKFCHRKFPKLLSMLPVWKQVIMGNVVGIEKDIQMSVKEMSNYLKEYIDINIKE